jgi:hypothetical protein
MDEAASLVSDRVEPEPGRTVSVERSARDRDAEREPAPRSMQDSTLRAGLHSPGLIPMMVRSMMTSSRAGPSLTDDRCDSAMPYHRRNSALFPSPSYGRVQRSDDMRPRSHRRGRGAGPVPHRERHRVHKPRRTRRTSGRRTQRSGPSTEPRAGRCRRSLDRVEYSGSSDPAPFHAACRSCHPRRYYTVGRNQGRPGCSRFCAGRWSGALQPWSSVCPPHGVNPDVSLPKSMSVAH